MRFLIFSTAIDGDRRLGLSLPDGTVLDLVAALEGAIAVPATLTEYIAAGPAFHEQVREAVAANASWPDDVIRQHDQVVLHAPLRPGKIIGVGLNYVEHVEESSRSLDTDKDVPTRPVLFSKPGTAVIGAGEPILHNSRLTAQLDWECELAVVIGASALSVAESDAFAHVFGYTILNDISARDQRRSGQWFFSKGQDSYAPLGPVVVTAD
ncbi:fumarylacetoacetate hydrolase family protein, partial [Streptomyces torulosus]|uniref:fumarylacetoacetate hydrolase family protein n=1 Tax=Streptomyces torulosus TaxID=68276 RepID=UPI0006EB6B2F